MPGLEITVYRLTYADVAVLDYYSQRYEVHPKHVLLTALRQVAAKDRSLKLEEVSITLRNLPELQENKAYKEEATEDLASFEGLRSGKSRMPLRSITRRSRTSNPYEQNRLRCSITPFDLVLIETYAVRGKVARDRVLRHMLRTFALADRNFDCAAFGKHVNAVGKQLSADERKALLEESKPYLVARPASRPAAASR